MQALVVDLAGGPFVKRAMPRSEPSAGQVLVRIHAASVNPLDTKIRAGRADHAKQPFPAVLGVDMAGTVEAVGAGVTGFAPGDAVFGMTGGVGGVQGTLAEYATVDARLIALKPAALSMRQAAALPLVAITAWEGLVDRAHVGTGHTVLVHGGSGGVGHIAVQIARARGATVHATSSAGKFAFVRELGAEPIDYKADKVEDYVRRCTPNGAGFDIVFDTNGGAVLDTSFAAIKRFGHVVSALGWGTHSLFPLSQRAGTYSGVFTLLPLITGDGREHHGEILRAVAALAEAGKLVPHLDQRRFTWDSIEEAYAAVASNQADGKVVVDAPL